MDEFEKLIEELKQLCRDLQRAVLEAAARENAQKAVVEGKEIEIRELRDEIMALKAVGGRG